MRAGPVPKRKGVRLSDCYGAGRVIGPWRKAAQAAVRLARS